MKHLMISLVLLLATVHCTQCIFFDNWSHLDLKQYEQGQAPMPFQGRIAIAQVLKLAHDSSYLQGYAQKHSSDVRQGKAHIYVEPFDADKVASEMIAGLSLAILVAATSAYGWRTWRACWWLAPSLVLVIFYISYAARDMQSLWYPYDLPHAALFTLALLAALDRRWGWMLLFFCLDVPVRETAIYLVPCLLALGYVNKQTGKALRYGAAMLIIWLVVTVAIHHHYRFNPKDTGVRLSWMRQAVVNPNHWSQVLSIFGFGWLPVWMGWRYLQRDLRALVIGASPGILVSGLFGIWIETRVWCEWNGIVAVMAFSIAAARFQSAFERKDELSEGKPVSSGGDLVWRKPA